MKAMLQDGRRLDGELTLEMVDAQGHAVWPGTATTRAFAQLEERHRSELLEAMEAAGFFTRPEPAVGPGPHGAVWRLRIVSGALSREIVFADARRSTRPTCGSRRSGNQAAMESRSGASLLPFYTDRPPAPPEKLTGPSDTAKMVEHRSPPATVGHASAPSSPIGLSTLLLTTEAAGERSRRNARRSLEARGSQGRPDQVGEVPDNSTPYAATAKSEA